MEPVIPLGSLASVIYLHCSALLCACLPYPRSVRAPSACLSFCCQSLAQHLLHESGARSVTLLLFLQFEFNLQSSQFTPWGNEVPVITGHIPFPGSGAGPGGL